MENSGDHRSANRITTIEQLRTLIGEPHPATPRKLLGALDQTALGFIARSPFLVLGTADAAGNQDVSPKGGAPGFVVAEDPSTLLIPDSKGNKLLFGLQNILANPHVGLIVMVPGTDETLRVNGTAELSVDPAVAGAVLGQRLAGPARDSDHRARVFLPLRKGPDALATVEARELERAHSFFLGKIPGP